MSWTELDTEGAHMQSDAWLSGIVSQLTLDKRMEVNRITVPPMERTGRVLHFRPAGPLRKGPNSDRLLYEFVRLTDATILRFAQRWGPLGLCREHGLPVLHKWRSVCLPAKRRDEFGEDVSQWLKLIARVKAILSIRAELSRGRIGSPRNWRTLYGDDPLGPSIDDRRHLLAWSVSGLLDAANVRPMVFAEPQLGIYFGAPGIIDMLAARAEPLHEKYWEWLSNSGTLYANLSIQLAFAVTNGLGLGTCDACGNFYQPSKAPRAGERHFCQKCGKKAAFRIAKRIARGASEAEALAQERHQPLTN
jgi:hypothetical protein